MLTWLKLRWHAAKLNGSAGTVDRRTLRVLANIPDPRAHKLLVDELAKWGRNSEQFRRLGGQDCPFLQDARGAVVEAMGQVRRPSSAIVEAMIYALFDHHPARKAATDALSTRMADVAPAKLPAVIEELHRNYEASRSRIYCFDDGLYAAAAVLRRIGTPGSLEGLFRMLGLGAEARRHQCTPQEAAARELGKMRRTEAIPHLLAVVRSRNTWAARCAAAGSLRQLGWNPSTAGRWLSSTLSKLTTDAGRSTSRALDEATELFLSTKSERDADQAMEKIVDFLERSPESAAEATLQKIAAFPVARTFESFVQTPPDDATARLLGDDAELHTFGRTERFTVNASIGAVLAALELARRRQG